MTRFALATLAFLASAPVAMAQTYPGPDTNWALESIDGAAFPANATLSFPEPDMIFGQAPCNSYRARVLSQYPDLELGPVRATMKACPDLKQEVFFLDRLAAATTVSLSDGKLTLTGPDGDMVFIPAPAAD